MGHAAIRFGAESVYDEVAVMIRHYKDVAPELYNSPERRRATELRDEQKAELRNFFNSNPELNEPARLLYTGFPRELKETVEKWKYYSDPDMLLELITGFEGKIYLDDILRTIGTGSFPALNGNYEQTGIRILPNVRSVHDPRKYPEDNGPDRKEKHWAWECDPGINQELRNIYYVENDALVVRGVPCKLNNVVLDHPFLEGKEWLTIAASPMANDIKLKMDYLTVERDTAVERRFAVKGLHNPKRAWARLEAAFLRACKERADIVMFPEMLGDELFIQPGSRHSRKMDDLIDKALEKGLTLPFLILMPTWWHDGHNELYVLSGENELKCVQRKYIPFIYREKDTKLKYMEDLVDTVPEVQLVHIDGVGRAAFMICRDMLETDYEKMLISALHCTLILCPSFSPHKTAFDLKDGQGRPNGCYIVWLNSCSASDDKMKHVGWVSSPVAEDYVTRFCPACGGKCGEDSMACLFLVKIGTGPENSGETECKPVHEREP